MNSTLRQKFAQAAIVLAFAWILSPFAAIGSGVTQPAAPPAGSTSVTTLGTVTTGTWHATPVTEAYGGTAQSSYTLGDVLYASASNTLAKLAGNTTTTKKYLSQTGTGSASAAPSWAQVAYADLSGSGSTNITTVGTIGTGTWQGTAVNATYIDSAIARLASPTFTGTPAAPTATAGTNTTQIASTAFVAAFTGTSNIVTVGTIGTGTWQGTKVAEAYGGTNQSTYTTGDILYASAANTLSKLAAGNSGYVLTAGGAGVAPSWAAAATTNPAGSGSELQYRSSSTAFGAVTGSSVSSGNLTIAGTINASGGSNGFAIGGVASVQRMQWNSTYFSLNDASNNATLLSLATLFSSNAVLHIGDTGGCLGTIIGKAATSGGAPTVLTVQNASGDNTVTASTECPGVNFAMAAGATGRQWAAGALTTQREILFQAPAAYRFASASTITNAATVAITAAPSAGTNATITNAYALWVQAGNARFDGGIDLSNIAAGTAEIIAAATSDTPSVTYGSNSTHNPSADPAGYIKITVGGAARYLPFYQ